MKKQLFNLFGFLLILSACQKKQYAYFQKSVSAPLEYKQSQVVSVQTPVQTTQEDNIIEPLLSEQTITPVNVSASLSGNYVDDILSFDEKKVQETFAPLTKIEQVLEVNEKISLEDIKKMGISNDIILDSKISNSIEKSDELPLNIPAFWWGCALGWIGILIVYLVTEDKEQTKKALNGCLVAGLIGLAVYIIIVVAAVGASSL
jgi:hypothetical protein